MKFLFRSCFHLEISCQSTSPLPKPESRIWSRNPVMRESAWAASWLVVLESFLGVKLLCWGLRPAIPDLVSVTGMPSCGGKLQHNDTTNSPLLRFSKCIYRSSPSMAEVTLTWDWGCVLRSALNIVFTVSHKHYLHVNISYPCWMKYCFQYVFFFNGG